MSKAIGQHASVVVSPSAMLSSIRRPMVVAAGAGSLQSSSSSSFEPSPPFYSTARSNHDRSAVPLPPRHSNNRGQMNGVQLPHGSPPMSPPHNTTTAAAASSSLETETNALPTPVIGTSSNDHHLFSPNMEGSATTVSSSRRRRRIHHHHHANDAMDTAHLALLAAKSQQAFLCDIQTVLLTPVGDDEGASLTNTKDNGHTNTKPISSPAMNGTRKEAVATAHEKEEEIEALLVNMHLWLSLHRCCTSNGFISATLSESLRMVFIRLISLKLFKRAFRLYDVLYSIGVKLSQYEIASLFANLPYDDAGATDHYMTDQQKRLAAEAKRKAQAKATAAHSGYVQRDVGIHDDADRKASTGSNPMHDNADSFASGASRLHVPQRVLRNREQMRMEDVIKAQLKAAAEAHEGERMKLEEEEDSHHHRHCHHQHDDHQQTHPPDSTERIVVGEKESAFPLSPAATAAEEEATVLAATDTAERNEMAKEACPSPLSPFPPPPPLSVSPREVSGSLAFEVAMGSLDPYAFWWGKKPMPSTILHMDFDENAAHSRDNSQSSTIDRHSSEKSDASIDHPSNDEQRIVNRNSEQSKKGCDALPAAVDESVLRRGDNDGATPPIRDASTSSLSSSPSTDSASSSSPSPSAAVVGAAAAIADGAIVKAVAAASESVCVGGADMSMPVSSSSGSHDHRDRSEDRSGERRMRGGEKTHHHNHKRRTEARREDGRDTEEAFLLNLRSLAASSQSLAAAASPIVGGDAHSLSSSSSSTPLRGWKLALAQWEKRYLTSPSRVVVFEKKEEEEKEKEKVRIDQHHEAVEKDDEATAAHTPRCVASANLVESMRQSDSNAHAIDAFYPSSSSSPSSPSSPQKGAVVIDPSSLSPQLLASRRALETLFYILHAAMLSPLSTTSLTNAHKGGRSAAGGENISATHSSGVQQTVAPKMIAMGTPTTAAAGGGVKESSTMRSVPIYWTHISYGFALLSAVNLTAAAQNVNRQSTLATSSRPSDSFALSPSSTTPSSSPPSLPIDSVGCCTLLAEMCARGGLTSLAVRCAVSGLLRAEEWAALSATISGGGGGGERMSHGLADGEAVIDASGEGKAGGTLSEASSTPAPRTSHHQFVVVGWNGAKPAVPLVLLRSPKNVAAVPTETVSAMGGGAIRGAVNADAYPMPVEAVVASTVDSLTIYTLPSAKDLHKTNTNPAAAARRETKAQGDPKDVQLPSPSPSSSSSPTVQCLPLPLPLHPRRISDMVRLYKVAIHAMGSEGGKLYRRERKKKFKLTGSSPQQQPSSPPPSSPSPSFATANPLLECAQALFDALPAEHKTHGLFCAAFSNGNAASSFSSSSSSSSSSSPPLTHRATLLGSQRGGEGRGMRNERVRGGGGREEHEGDSRAPAPPPQMLEALDALLASAEEKVLAASSTAGHHASQRQPTNRNRKRHSLGEGW